MRHGALHPGGREKLRFGWESISRTGNSTKDVIAPAAFDCREKGTFRMGTTIGAVSFVQIIAPELTDRMLADFLDLDSAVMVNLHIRSIDQAEAIKSVKRKLTDLDRMRIEEQKKAVRSGYDMDVLPPDLVTYGKEAQHRPTYLHSRR